MRVVKCSGPEKGYVDGLESRLYEVESILLHALPLVTDDQLELIVLVLDSSGNSDRSSEGGTRYSSSKNRLLLPSYLEQRQGLSYWQDFPLCSAAHIRRWQRDCESRASHQLQRYQMAKIAEWPKHFPTAVVAAEPLVSGLYPRAKQLASSSRASFSVPSSPSSDCLPCPYQVPSADYIPRRTSYDPSLLMHKAGSQSQSQFPLTCGRQYTVGPYFRQNANVPSGLAEREIGVQAAGRGRSSMSAPEGDSCNPFLPPGSQFFDPLTY